jgi:glycosyltransferase involved in cell wall biosynthesis
MSRTVVLLAPVANVGALVRTRKIASVLSREGLDILHLAWKRDSAEPDNEPPIATRTVLEGGGYKNRALIRWYLRYMAGLRRALRGLPAGSDVYALSLWSAHPAASLARKRRLNLFFDDNDTLSLAYPWPKPVRPVIARMERRAAAAARIHLVPSAARWPSTDPNLRVVPNYPLTDDLDRAEEIARSKGYGRDGTFTLYVNGWLAPTRGLDSLVRALEVYDGPSLRVLLAGRIDPTVPQAARLMEHPFAEYLGEVTPAESLALYHRAHACLTFYDPSLAINRLAESNKWGDCVLTRCAILVNEEVATAQPYLEVGGAAAVPYGDPSALAALLRRWAQNPNEPLEMGARLARLPFRPWDEAMSALVREWLG